MPVTTLIAVSCAASALALYFVGAKLDVRGTEAAAKADDAARRTERDALRRALSAHVGLVLERQEALASIAGARDYTADLETGVLRFGDDVRLRIEVLGSESTVAGTWLWSFANDSVREELTGTAQSLSARLEAMGLGALRPNSFPLALAKGEELCALSVGLGLAQAYYRAPYDGGAAFLLVVDPSFPVPPGVTDPVAFAGLAMRAVSAFEVDHRVAVEKLAEAHGASVEGDASKLTISFGDAGTVAATFDAQGRITALKAHAKPRGSAKPA